MKLTKAGLLLFVAVSMSSCLTFEREAPPRRVIVTESSPVVRETVVTTLPAGYRTRRYQGSDYYSSGDTYYRTSRGGYVVVPRPW